MAPATMAAVTAQNCSFNDRQYWHILFYSIRNTCLVKTIQQFGDEGRSWAGVTEGVPQAKVSEIADKATFTLG